MPPRMVEVRPNPSSRLNLLVSHGGWQDDSWADRLPRLLEPMGIRSFRVTSGREAQHLVEHHPVHIAVVDLALPLEPDGSPSPTNEGGPRLLELLARLDRRPDVIVVKRRRASRDEARELTAALQLGAFAALDPPVQLELLLKVLQRILNKRYADRWPCDPNDQPPSEPRA
ncbi:MAG: hypothetical protein AAGI30_06755 [Planctomycetota bacterium]